MSKRRPRLEPRFKLWLSSRNAEGAFGDGKWRLLKAIETEGSLKAATELLGISYRKAWGDLRKAEKCLGVIFIERHRGGDSGGATTLTEAGRKWMAGYSRFRAAVERATDKAFNSHMVGLTGKSHTR